MFCLPLKISLINAIADISIQYNILNIQYSLLLIILITIVIQYSTVLYAYKIKLYITFIVDTLLKIISASLQ